MRREFSQWRAAIDAHVLVSVTDRAGRILEVNDLFCQISGFSREELIGSNHQVMNSGAHSHEFMRELRGTIGAGKTWRGVVCNRTKGGELFWVDTTIVPLLDTEGRTDRFLSLRTDVTAQRRGPSYSTAAATEVNRLLSLREIEVLSQLGDGTSTKEAASALGLSPKTVETHRHHIERKLGVHGQVALAKIALRAGLAAL